MDGNCTGREIASLQRVLTQIYDDSPSINRILDEVQIDRGALPLSTSIENTWYSALREACFSEMLDDLLEVVTREYPNHPALQTVITEYRQTTFGPGDGIDDPSQSPLWIGDSPVLARNFVGREQVLDQIAELLDDDSSGRPRVIAVHGLSGIGKTQLIRAFLSSEAERFEAIVWLQAESEGQIIAGMARAAIGLGIPGADAMEATEAARAAKIWLEQHNRAVAVFDSGGPEVVAQFLPRIGTATVFITSNSPDWRGLTSRGIALTPLSEEDSVDFLLQRTGKADAESARVIAAELGGLPIALEQAGAYVEQTDGTLGNYLTLLRTSIQELMNFASPTAAYPRSFFAALLLSLTAAKEREAGVEDLLMFIAQLGAGPIPREIVQQGLQVHWENNNDVLSDLKVNSLIAAARSYSLILTSSEVIQMHPLVARCLRSSAGRESETAWAHFVLKVLSYKLPLERDSSEDWWIYRELSEHVIELAKNIDSSALEDEGVLGALEHTAAYLGHMGQYEEAFNISSMIVEFAGSEYGVDSCRYARALNNSYYAAECSGRKMESAEALVKAIAILEAISELSDDCRFLLGVVYSNRAKQILRKGDYDASEAMLDTAYSIHSKMEGTEAEIAASVDLNNLGTIYRERKEYDRARLAFDEAAKSHRKNLEGNDARLSVVLLNLAGMESVLGQKVRAEALLEEAIKIDDEIFSDVYLFDRIHALAGLAALLTARGEHSPSVKLYDRVLAIVGSSPEGQDQEFITMLENERRDAYREMMRQATKLVAPVTVKTNTEEAYAQAEGIQRTLRRLGLPVKLKGFEDSSW